VSVTRGDIERCSSGIRSDPCPRDRLHPARVILQDFHRRAVCGGLAAMRDAIVRLGGNAERVNR